MRAAVPLLAAGVLALLLPGPAAPAQDPPPAGEAEDAPATLDPAELKALLAEGEKWFETSGDVELPRPKRDEARKKAYGPLRKASRMLDLWTDEHPEDMQKYGATLTEVNHKLYWLRKESPVGLLDEFLDKPTGGSQTSDWGPRPPPEREPPAGGPSPGAAPTPPPAGAPAPAASRPPPKPSGPFENALAFETDRPFDHSGALELWMEVLAATEDRTSEAFRTALGRVSALSEELKRFYRKVRNEDPDSLDPERDAGKAAAVAASLAEGLQAPDPKARREAASQIAELGYTPAGLALFHALRKEKEDAVRADLFLAMVRLGGRRTCEHLARVAKERDAPLAREAVRSLAAVARKDAVQARYASLALGEFVAGARAEGAARAALDELRRMGTDGVPGLLAGLETRDGALEVEVIGALGETRDPRAAGPLAARLEMERTPGPRLQAAQEALRSIGRPAIPALIEALRKSKTRRYAGTMLYEVSGGQPFGEDPRAWTEWWKTQ